MLFKRLFLIFLSAVLLCLSFGGCKEDYKDAFIYIDFDTVPTNLDPQLADSDEELTVVRALFDTLLRYNKDGKIVCSGAESYKKDGNTYTFKLKKDAKWVSGEKVTAHDYVFALRRAVESSTKAPYASSLFSIVNAKEIYEGKVELSSLGVSAPDDYTLKIQLKEADSEFEKVLTTAVAMPCNEKFFNSCKGKYGLTIDTTASCGSYYVKQWLTESKFLIRLAKNLDFTGEFEANSMRIYFTCAKDDALTMLEHDNTDLAYISNEEYGSVSGKGFKISSVEDTCYTLFLSSRMDAELRKAFLTSIDQSSYKSDLVAAESTALSLYPKILSASGAPKASDLIKYDDSSAAAIYKKLEAKGAIPESISIKYPDGSSAEKVARSLAAHWQKSLSCFINIEKTPINTINDMYNSTYYDIIIIPFSAPSGTVSAYNKKLGFAFDNPKTASEKLFNDYRCYPLYYSSTNIAAGSKIQNLDSAMQGGIIDVSILIKMQ